LPLATAVDEPLVVTAEGGTDVTWSPTMAYYRRVKLPLLREHGLTANVAVERRGFYPAGGGRATLSIAPSTLDPIDRRRRGSIDAARIVSVEAVALADRNVADRQATAVQDRLEGADVAVVERTVGTWASDSPGSAVCVRLEGPDAIAGFDALGERGTPAEEVGASAAEEALAFLEGEAAVDRHAADQLLVFLAMAGGEVHVPAETDHVATCRDLLAAFGFETTLETSGATPVLRAP
jgi:RNA 3'-terminal phosphate cyclase (ATP)